MLETLVIIFLIEILIFLFCLYKVYKAILESKKQEEYFNENDRINKQ
jgi:beta-lactamase regulating signal transducer with metallopeptidase domain